ncbi:MAG: hypothetical protein MI975_06950 [Cytophagales bacterium]|nr:hypothetical protein [Cytophagales bacterium]
MEISELKSALELVSAPDRLKHSGKQMINSSNFIAHLKKADTRHKVLLRRFYITYFVIAAFYLGLFVLNPDPELKFSDRVNGSLLFLGILLFAVLGKIKFTELKHVRYEEPSLVFLKKALDRYKFWAKEMNYGLVLVAVINIGSCRSYVTNYSYFESTVTNIVAFELVFFTAVGIAVFVGYRHWSIHKKPVADEIRTLLGEMKQV